MRKVISGAVCAAVGGGLVAAGFALGRMPRATEAEPPAPDAAPLAASPGKPAPTEHFAPKAVADSPQPPLPPDPNAPGERNRDSGWERAGERQLKTYEHVVPGRLLAVSPRDPVRIAPKGSERLYSITYAGAQSTFHLAPLHWPKPPRMRPPFNPQGEQFPPPIDFEPVAQPVTAPWPNRGDTRVTSAGIYALAGTTVQMFELGLHPRWTKNVPVPKDAAPDTTHSRIISTDDSHIVVCSTSHDHRPKGERRALVTVMQAGGGDPRTCAFQLSGEDFVGAADPAHERFYVFGKEHVQCRSLKDGKQLWEAKFPNDGFFGCSIVTNGGGVLVCARDRATWYDTDGRASWTHPPLPFGDIRVAVADGSVYALANGTLTAAELVTGKVLWHTKVDDHFQVERVAVDEKSVYVYGGSFGPTSLYRLHRETGVVCWRANLPSARGSWDNRDFGPDEYPRFEPRGYEAFFILAPDRPANTSRMYRILGL